MFRAVMLLLALTFAPSVALAQHLHDGRAAGYQ